MQACAFPIFNFRCITLWMVSGCRGLDLVAKLHIRSNIIPKFALQAAKVFKEVVE